MTGVECQHWVLRIHMCVPYLSLTRGQGWKVTTTTLTRGHCIEMFPHCNFLANNGFVILIYTFFIVVFTYIYCRAKESLRPCLMAAVMKQAKNSYSMVMYWIVMFLSLCFQCFRDCFSQVTFVICWWNPNFKCILSSSRQLVLNGLRILRLTPCFR